VFRGDVGRAGGKAEEGVYRTDVTIATLFTFRPQHMAGVTCESALSPDGRQLACHVASEFVILDSSSGALLVQKEYAAGLRKLAYSAASQWLGMAFSSEFALWDSRTLSCVATHGCEWDSFAFAPDGSHIAVADGDRVRCLGLGDFHITREAPDRFKSPRDLAYSPDGNVLAVSCQGGVSLLCQARG